MKSDAMEVDRHLGSLLSEYGFVIDEVTEGIEFKDRPAWAVFYRRDDCKLQICWSAREGSTDFMLAKPDVPNGFGLAADATGWHFLLMLSDFDDGLATPAIDAGSDVWWEWRSELFVAHFPYALRSLQRQKL